MSPEIRAQALSMARDALHGALAAEVEGFDPAAFIESRLELVQHHLNEGSLFICCLLHHRDPENRVSLHLSVAFQQWAKATLYGVKAAVPPDGFHFSAGWSHRREDEAHLDPAQGFAPWWWSAHEPSFRDQFGDSAAIREPMRQARLAAFAAFTAWVEAEVEAQGALQ